MEKMTNVRAIDYVLGNCEVPTDVKEKLEKMKEQFVKKNSKERKPTANQTENVGFKADILAYLATVEKATITDLMKNVPSLADLSNQRVSAIVRQLKDSGEVVREEIKRKAYFSVPTDEEVDLEDQLKKVGGKCKFPLDKTKRQCYTIIRKEMSRMDKQVEKLMKALDITEEEALQVIADDKAIDKGEKLFELSAEQKKASKSARQGDRKPTVYKFDTSKRKRPENVGKRTLIETIQNALAELGADGMEVTNPERELNFSVDGVKYKVVLSCPRK